MASRSRGFADEVSFDLAVSFAQRIMAESLWTRGRSTGEIFSNYLDGEEEELPQAEYLAKLSLLIQLSKEYRSVWNAVNMTAQGKLRDGVLMPQVLADWTADVLAGFRPSPLKRKDPNYMFAERTLVGYAVGTIASIHGVKAVRNTSFGSNCRFEGGSACDAVGKAANKSYKSVESYWLDYKKRFPDMFTLTRSE